MSHIQYNLQFEALCRQLRLGEVIGIPEAISGGFLHRMYAVETATGKYAIKALNPQIMLRPTAMANYIASEDIARIAAGKVGALPAIRANGTCLHEIEDQYYLVFDWIDGSSLTSAEITPEHCMKMGDVLAELHLTDFSGFNIPDHRSEGAQLINWNRYLQLGRVNGAEWLNLLLANQAMLAEWNAQAIESENLLSADLVISHRDLDPKNVLWNQGRPIVIDWEAAGYVNPMKELIETAMYWSENTIGLTDQEKFTALINGYKQRYGSPQANWSIVLAGIFGGKLDWLEYNLKRSLWIECTDPQEQRIGTVQVTETIQGIKRYADAIPQIVNWLR
ncbi:phosphotransferase [Paenibacillus azoreducens]|uniref:phosphotransferase n=1 Tax=Paenibacillus azoreducens TaxID=116718 RepID=UPI0039F5FB9F